MTHLRGETRQINHYYPYGLSISGLGNSSDEYLNKYTSKELQTGEFEPAVSTGLEMFDFHARFYDPQLGRWFTPDPAEQFHNPYLAMGRTKREESLRGSDLASGQPAREAVMCVDPDGEFVLGIGRGFLDAVFSEGLELWNADQDYVRDAWREADPTLKGTAGNNSVRTWWGLFQGDGKQILSRFTWELPQTILGYNSAQLANTLGNVESVEYYDGATVVSGNNKNLVWNLGGQAVTMGSYIIGGSKLEASTDNDLLRHEYGHYLQSQEVGPIYITKFGIPSLLSIDGSHDYHPVEQDANIRGLKYFRKKDGSNPWNTTSYPILGFDDTTPYSSANNQQALKAGRIRTTGWDYLPGWRFLPQTIYYTIKYRQEQKENTP
ncbi:hypothetical protein G3O08_03820 [Cryomorpha ignava]|uniref:RHS repeat-associated core domain-containing protein n=1 Tax=Cryomorpha ignava TaxID=101383 RepID=A0A7K3WP45_9FLAO|nr:hypothetical protein [Cryomorpha ignava]NEN22632.1 hypothetical protein [Cryomorpha ignava]